MCCADENRGHLLNAGFVDAVVQLLENYTLLSPSGSNGPLALYIPDLKLVKTSIGFLLNASIGFGALRRRPEQVLTGIDNTADLVKARLTSLRAVMTILKLSMSIYPPGAWLTQPELPVDDSPDPKAARLESWNLRSGLSSWTWRVISELRDADEEARM